MRPSYPVLDPLEQLLRLSPATQVDEALAEGVVIARKRWGDDAVGYCGDPRPARRLRFFAFSAAWRRAQRFLTFFLWRFL
jgi:hypothetical protein